MLNFWLGDKGTVKLVPIWPNAGAPNNGATGTMAGMATPGDLLVDTTNKALYQNTGTQTSPVWSPAAANEASVAITGGTIDGVVIGGTTPVTETAAALHIDSGTKTATATSGAATLNKMAGAITSESLTTAAGAEYTLTLTNSSVAAADQVFASVRLGTATTGSPAVVTITPGAGQVVIIVQNIAASAALNGTIVISFVVFKN